MFSLFCFSSDKFGKHVMSTCRRGTEILSESVFPHIFTKLLHLNKNRTNLNTEDNHFFMVRSGWGNKVGRRKKYNEIRSDRFIWLLQCVTCCIKNVQIADTGNYCIKNLCVNPLTSKQDRSMKQTNIFSSSD